MRVLVAVLLAAAILYVGLAVLRALAQRGPGERIEPEDVSDLGVVFRCGECGTEFRVERLGETQVPRHCGERMLVERRPRPGPSRS